MEHRIHRYRERERHDREELYELLDGEQFAVLATVTDEGEPWAIPISYGRWADRIVLHGSTGAGLLRAAAAGALVVLTVVHVDALVVGDRGDGTSSNYRSATIRGSLQRLEGAEKIEALNALLDSYLPGRSGEVPQYTRKELAATMVATLAVEEDNWVYKTRTGMPSEPDGQAAGWAGVVPIQTRFGAPVAASWAEGPVPASVRALLGPDDRPGA